MAHRMKRIVGVATSLVAATQCILFAAPPFQVVDDTNRDFFESRIRPLLAESCFQCHGAETQKGGLRLDHIRSMMSGGDSGPAIVPFDVPGSRLRTAVRYDDLELQMPPKGKLSDAAISDLEHWIEIGAPWPDEPEPQAAAAPVFDLAKRKSEHWCWQPIVATDPPPLADDAWSRGPIDRFLLSRMRELGLKPAREADRETLIRRVTFDLIGLPPTPDEVSAFLADSTPDAFERLVDRLLASPRFGEHWARRWMDLTRYVETYGHEFDYPIENAWRYRDYLIRALDRDVPYDQMVKEHLAGDLLASPRLDPETGTNESVVATAHYFFPQATHGPVDSRQDEADRVDNQIDVLSKSFLGLTVSCARCHDHKFDAISTKDYYALAGFMKSSRRTTVLLDPHGEIAKREAQLAELRAQRAARVEELTRLDPRVTFEQWQHYQAAMEGLSLAPGAEHAIEAEEAAPIEPPKGHYAPQDMRGFGEGRWTGDRHMWWVGAQPGDALKLAWFVPMAGKYRFAASFTKARDYGRFSVAVNGTPLATDLDFYAPNVEPTGFLELGEVDLPMGNAIFEFEVIGRNDKAVPAYMLGIDQLRFTRVDDASAWRATLAERASAARLDPDRLERILALSSLDRAPEGDLSRPAHPTRTFEDFADVTDWVAHGPAFAAETRHQGITFDPQPRAIGRDGSTVVDSRLGSRRFEGSLRSASFVIDSDWIQYRLMGERSRVRLIVDSYQLDVFNALLFEGFTFEVNAGESAAWYVQRVGKYRGHRAHIELLDEGDGWIAADEIVFANSPDRVAVEAPMPRPAAIESVKEPRDALLRDGRFLLTDPAIMAIAERYRAIEAGIPAPIHALGIEDGFGEDEYVFVRGKHSQRGPEVERRFLEALGGGEALGGDSNSGRLALAERWFAASNPLPARVAVNRFWHHLFGRGIVPTVDDFGKLGELPSHPALLDWLANWFVHSAHWSQKALLRQLVLSAAYRMSSDAADPAAEQVDPQNRALHRMSLRRLPGESIRDAMLAISGSLDLAMYGPSVPIHLTPFMDGRGRPGVSGPLDGAGRRTVYQEIRRNFLSPFLLAFDTPMPSTTVGRRSVSNVPAQALILMNDPFVADMAKRTADRLAQRMASSADESGFVTALYAASYGRVPTADEVTLAHDFLAAQIEGYAAIAPDARIARARADLTQVLWNAKEFWFLR